MPGREREGRAGKDYHKPHQREKPDCRLHNEPVQKNTRPRVMKPQKRTDEPEEPQPDVEIEVDAWNKTEDEAKPPLDIEPKPTLEESE